MNFNKNKFLFHKFDINYNKINNKFLRLKPLFFKKKKSLGKKNGQIVMRYKGGGHKKNYRLLMQNKKFFTNIALVRGIEYDPNRSTRIALIQYLDGTFSYILASKNLVIMTYIYFFDENLYETINFHKILPGFKGILNLSLNITPIGIPIFNIEQFPGSGAKYCKSAGTAGMIIKKNNNYSLIKLPSKKEKLFLLDCLCTLGLASNIFKKYHKKYKAGTNRWLNRKPHVRGVAKNPVDHPHGGGEGKTSGGRPSVSPWGYLTKGVPTRNKKKKKLKF